MKDITSYLNDGTLYDRIKNLDGVHVGNYVVTNGIKVYIGGFDPFLNTGDTALTTHHAVMIPETFYTTSYMNATNTTEGGYKGSYMFKTKLPEVLATWVTPYFGNHVISHRTLVTNVINPTGTNRWGSASGCSSSWEWASEKLALMSEPNVYGAIAWSSSGYDIGIHHMQFPIFRLMPEFMVAGRNWYWLRAVARATYFCDADGGGLANADNASNVHGVRPYFLID